MKMNNQYVHGSTATKIRRQAADNRAYETVKKPKQKTVQWTPLYVIMLSAVVIGFLVIILSNIAVSSEVTALRAQKSRLTDNYEELVLSNNLYYDNIMSKVDLGEIERVAVVELGMSMAKKGQIVEYSGDMEDYVKQYVDLPQ